MNFKEEYNVLKRNIADDLFSIVIKRYQNEKPEVELTNDMMDKIWYSLYGELNHKGKESAYEYARTAKLL
jgi:hypothetical protein